MVPALMFPASVMVSKKLLKMLRICVVVFCILIGGFQLLASHVPLTGTQAHGDAAGHQGNPAIAFNLSRNGVVVWEDGTTESASHIKAQRLNADGVPVGDVIPVSIATGGPRSAAAVAIGLDGKFF